MEYSENPWAEDRSGEVLAGRYKLIRRIGRGGMGSVYLGIHQAIQKKVAIKLLDGQLVGQADFASRFVREAQSASRLRHGNIVDVTDFGETGDGSVFLVMEYLEGEDLGATLEREHRLPWPRVKHIVLQVLRALHCAHEGGILHRDIKLENCFRIQNLSDHDFIKVLDFGNAKEIASHPDVGVEVPLKRGRLETAVGVIVGTAAYISPEQAQQLPLDARSDLYSVGVMIFELLTGRLPFEAATFMGVLNKHINDWPPTLREFAPDVEISDQVESLVAKLLAKTPDERYASAAKVAQAIQSIPDGTPMVGPSIWFAPPRKDTVDTRTLQVPAGQDPAIGLGLEHGNGQSPAAASRAPVANGRQHRQSVNPNAVDRNQSLQAQNGFRNRDSNGNLRSRIDALSSTAVLSGPRNGENRRAESADQLLREQAEDLPSSRGGFSNRRTRSHGVGQSYVEFGPGILNSQGDELRRKTTDRELYSSGETDIESELGGTSPLNTISRSSSRLSSRSIPRSAINSGQRTGLADSFDSNLGVDGSEDEFELRTGWWSSIAASFRRLFGRKNELESHEEYSFSTSDHRSTSEEPDESHSSGSTRSGSPNRRSSHESHQVSGHHSGIDQTVRYSDRDSLNAVGTSEDIHSVAESSSKTTQQLDFQSKASGSHTVSSVTEGSDMSLEASAVDVSKDLPSKVQSIVLDDSGFVWEGVPSRDPALLAKKNTQKVESGEAKDSAQQNLESSNQAEGSMIPTSDGELESESNSHEVVGSPKNQGPVDANTSQLDSNTSIVQGLSSRDNASDSDQQNTVSSEASTQAITDLVENNVASENGASQETASASVEQETVPPTIVYDSRRVEDEWDEILDRSSELSPNQSSELISEQVSEQAESDASISRSKEEPQAAREGDRDASESSFNQEVDKTSRVEKSEEKTIENATVALADRAIDSEKLTDQDQSSDVVVAKETTPSKEAESLKSRGDEEKAEEKPDSETDETPNSSSEDGESKVVALDDERRTSYEQEEANFRQEASFHAASSFAMTGASSEIGGLESENYESFELQAKSHGVRNFLVTFGAVAVVLVAIFGLGSGSPFSIFSSVESTEKAGKLAVSGVKESSLIPSKSEKTSFKSKLLDSRPLPGLDKPGSDSDLPSRGATSAKDRVKPTSLPPLVDSSKSSAASETKPNSVQNPARRERSNTAPSAPNSSAEDRRIAQKSQPIRQRPGAVIDRERRGTKPRAKKPTTSNPTTSRIRQKVTRNKESKVQLSSVMTREIRQCGRKFGGFPGDRIELKLEVQASGVLSQVRTKGKRVGNDLAACIESKLSGKKIESTGAGKIRHFVRL